MESSEWSRRNQSDQPFGIQNAMDSIQYCALSIALTTNIDSKTATFILLYVFDWYF